MNKTKEKPSFPDSPLTTGARIGDTGTGGSLGEREWVVVSFCVWDGRQCTAMLVEYFHVGRPRSIVCCNASTT